MDKTSPKLSGIASTILKAEAHELINVADRIDESVVKAAKILLKHDGKVVVCGVGKSGLIGQKIVATFCSTGTQAVFLHASDALHGDLGIYRPGDPTILISKSGATDEVVRLIPLLREFNSPLIGIIGNNGSGKSTLLNLLTQELEPDSGSISKGETIKFGYYKQEGIKFEGDQKVLDLVKERAEVI